MAARRLLILLLALFAGSTFAAALIPVPEQSSRETSTTRQARRAPAERTRLERVVRTDAARPKAIRLTPGDSLRLTVRAPRFAQVEIPRLGVLEDVGPYAPASLELSPPAPGGYPVRLLETGRVIARLEVGRSAD